MSGENLMILLASFPDRETAERTARQLVDGGLAVGARVGAELLAFHRHEGGIRSDRETEVVFEVLGDRFQLFYGELKLQHSDTAPRLLAWPASQVDPDYLARIGGKGTGS